MNRVQAAEQLRKVIQMFAATLTDEQAIEIATVYPAYAAGVAYKVDDLITYGENNVGDPQLYRVVQAHTSQLDWPPDGTPALYTPIGLDDSGYPIWSPDAYPAGWEEYTA